MGRGILGQGWQAPRGGRSPLTVIRRSAPWCRGRPHPDLPARLDRQCLAPCRKLRKKKRAEAGDTETDGQDGQGPIPTRSAMRRGLPPAPVNAPAAATDTGWEWRRAGMRFSQSVPAASRDILTHTSWATLAQHHATFLCAADPAALPPHGRQKGRRTGRLRRGREMGAVRENPESASRIRTGARGCAQLPTDFMAALCRSFFVPSKNAVISGRL